MWRTATRSVAPGLGADLSPLSAFHKRVIGQGSQGDYAAANNASHAPGSRTPLQLLLANLNQAPPAAQDEAQPSAAQQAYDEWSRQVDVPSLALAFDQLPVTPLDLGPQFEQRVVAPVNKQPAPFWEQQDLQLLQILLQDPPQEVQPGPAASEVVASSAQQGISTSPVAPGTQGQPQLWDAAAPAHPSSAAAAARDAVDALLDAGTPLVGRPIPMHTSPFALSAPAALPAAPAQLQAPAAAGTRASFTSPFTQVAAGQLAQQGDQQHQQLHAPALPPGWTLPPAQTTSSMGQLPGSVCTPPLAPKGVSAPATLALEATAADTAFMHGTSTAQYGSRGTLSSGDSVAAINEQHRSPFLMVEAWQLNPGGSTVSGGGAAGQTSRSSTALLHAYGRTQQMRQQQMLMRGNKRRAAVSKPPAKPRATQHSSTAKRLLLARLQAEMEAKSDEYQALAALNSILQQRWAAVSAAFDGLPAAPNGQGVPTAAAAGPQPGQQQHLLGQPAGAAGDPATAAASAAAAASGAGGVYDDDALDALAGVVHSSWTNTLFQMVDLLPFLDDSTNRLGPAPQQQQPQQHTLTDASPAVAQPLHEVDVSPFAMAAGAAVATTEGTGPATLAGGSCFAAGIEGASVEDELGDIPVNACSDGAGHSKRPRAARSRDSFGTDQLSLLLHNSLSLHAAPAKQPRLNSSGDTLCLTQSDLHLTFSATPSMQPHAQQQQAEDPQLLGLNDSAQQQQQDQGLCSPKDPEASAAAALSAAGLMNHLWALFEQVSLAGPALLYRCFGPKPASCPCCCPGGQTAWQQQQQELAGMPCNQQPARGMLALLLDSEAGGACPAAPASTPVAPGAAAAAGGPPALQELGVAVPATGAHWQRAASCLALTPEQQACLHQVWLGVQAAHATCASKREQVVAALRRHTVALSGLQAVAAHNTCQAGVTAAAVTDQLLADIDNSLAADYGVLLETSKRLWGDESPLTLAQKANCLVASYPFLPDYGLLACLATGTAEDAPDQV